MNPRLLSEAVTDLDTPCLVLDAEQARHNMERAATAARRAGLELYPHVKSHKSLEIAAAWLRLDGVGGLTCQTLGEAEVMLAATPERIVLPGPVVGEHKMPRLAALARDVRLTVAVSGEPAAEALSDALTAAGQTAAVLIEVDTGYARCGADPGQVVRLARYISGRPALALEGVLTYEGHVYEHPGAAARAAADAYDVLAAAVSALRADGFAVERVSVGASAGRDAALTHHLPTEVRWGSALYGDATLVDTGAMTVEECALGVLATVVCVREDRYVIDAGAKTLSYTPAAAGGTGYGVVFPGGQRITRLADEHAMIDGPPGTLKVADRVLVLPNAHAAAVDLHEICHVVSGAGLRPAPLRIDARGRTR